MKLFIFIFAACVFGVRGYDFDNTKIDILDVPIKIISEKFREFIKEGGFGVPPLDPFTNENYTMQFENQYLSLEVNTKGNSMEGLSGFVISDLDFKVYPPRMNFNFTFPHAGIKSEKYDFLGLVFGALPIYGEGSALFDLINTQLYGYVSFKIKHKILHITDVKPYIQIGEISSKLNGMLGGGDIDNVINAMLEDLAPEFVNYYSEPISEYMSYQLRKALTDSKNTINVLD